MLNNSIIFEYRILIYKIKTKIMKKIILTLAILISALTFTGCKKKDIKPVNQNPIENPIDTNYINIMIWNTGSEFDTLGYQVNNITQLDSSYNVYMHTLLPQDSDSTYFQLERGNTYRFFIGSQGNNSSHTWIYINGELDFHQFGNYYYDKVIN